GMCGAGPPVVLALPASVQAGGGRAVPKLPYLEARAQPAALRQPRLEPGPCGAGHGLPGLDALQPLDPPGVRTQAEGHLRGIAASVDLRAARRRAEVARTRAQRKGHRTRLAPPA